MLFKDKLAYVTFHHPKFLSTGASGQMFFFFYGVRGENINEQLALREEGIKFGKIRLFRLIIPET